jgi:isoleucyl-tRNA synthetase
MLGNIGDFDPAKDAVPRAELEELDRYMLHRLAEMIEQVAKSYEVYEFHKVYQTVHNFCAVDLSALYLDILKDRLYASAQDAPGRRSAQTVLFEVTSALARLLAPVLAHTAEEVWQELPEKSQFESVHLAPFPEAKREWFDAELAGRWSTLLEVRDKVLLKLEEARQSGVIGKPLESKVKLAVEKKLYSELVRYESILPAIFIVSQVELVEADQEDIQVGPPSGSKCARCWLVLESVGQNTEHPSLCDRCIEAVG